MPTNKETFTAAMNDEVDTLNSKTGGNTKLQVIQLATETATITPLNADTLTVTPTTSQQEFTPTAPKNGFNSVTVNAISPIKTAADLAASGKTVTVPAGYYASQATKDVADGSVTISNTSITANPSIVVNTSTGVITSNVSGSESITPTVNAGYVSNVSGATASVSGSATVGLTTQAAATITPTSSAQTAVAAGKFTLGAVGVEAVVCMNLSAGNIKDGVTVKIGTATDDDSVTSITGTYQGGGSYTKPSYLISDGDSVSTFYFNTEYDLASVLAQMTYVTDPYTGYNVCEIGIGYFYSVKLSANDYAFVWNDGTIVPIYSTTPVPSFGVTTAGWQVSSFTPTAAVTVSAASIISAFAAIMDSVVAEDDIAFGSHGGGSQPTLNAPTISFTSGTMNLKIADPTTNGNFTTGFKIFVDGVETYTTSRTGTTTTYDMSGLSANTAAITVKAAGTNFTDSVESASATFYKYFTVRMYDGETLKKTSSVAYGAMPTYTPTKTGYTFDHWEDSNGNTVTQIAADTDLFAAWVSSPYIAAGVYNVIDNRTSKNNINININFTWKKKTAPSSTATGTALYYKESYGIGVIYCTKNAADSDRIMPYVSSGTDGSRWYPENFMYSENGYYKITVTSDTNVTAEQKAQFEYYFEPFTAT